MKARSKKLLLSLAATLVLSGCYPEDPYVPAPQLTVEQRKEYTSVCKNSTTSSIFLWLSYQPTKKLPGIRSNFRDLCPSKVDEIEVEIDHRAWGWTEQQ